MHEWTNLWLFLFVAFFFRHNEGLGAQRVKRVAIIGAGPAGLSFAAALNQLEAGCDEVVVFESRSDYLQTKLGGGVQLSGGAFVLRELGCLPALDSIAERFERVWGRNIQGDTLLDLDVARVVTEKARDVLCESSIIMVDEGSSGSSSISSSSVGKPLLYSIMRDALQQLLFEATTKQMMRKVSDAASTGKAVPFRQTNTRVEANRNVEGVFEEEDQSTTSALYRRGGSTTLRVAFSDGSSQGDFDFVYGADGVSSTCRSSMLAASSKKKQEETEKEEEEAPRYTGIRICYGITEPDPSFALRPNGRGCFHQTFANGCYVLSASYGGLQGVQHMMAIVYRDENDAKFGENAMWKSRSLSSIGGAMESQKAQAKRRLVDAGLGQNTPLLTLLDACSEDRFIDLGVKDRTFMPLGSWSSPSGRVVLGGDSAHAMAPFLGQGTNQALQDALVLARGIKAINEQQEESISNFFKSAFGTPLQQLALDYQRRRKPTTTVLGAKANLLGYVETLGGPVGSFVRDYFFRTMAKLGVAEFIFLDGARPRV